MYGDQSRKFVFQNKFELLRFLVFKAFFQAVFRSIIQIFMSNTGQYFKTLDLMLNNNYTISDS